MIAKEWWEARWKVALAVLAVLAFVALAPRSYEAVVRGVEDQIGYVRAELAAPERYLPPEEALPPGYTRAEYAEYLRSDIEEMRRPEYPAEQAWREIAFANQSLDYLVLVPLAGVLGVALVSGEVSRGSILLLLSRPISRTRIFLTKYLLGAVILLAVALLAGVGTVISGYAHGYPPSSPDIAEIMASSGLFFLGTLSVLGVTALASVIFEDVIRSAVASLVVAYAAMSAQSWTSGIAQGVWLLTHEEGFEDSPMVREGWYESFEVFRITRYWSTLDPFEGGGPFEMSPAMQAPAPSLSILVCLIAAALPLLVALWLFLRKSY